MCNNKNGKEYHRPRKVAHIFIESNEILKFLWTHVTLHFSTNPARKLLSVCISKWTSCGTQVFTQFAYKTKCKVFSKLWCHFTFKSAFNVTYAFFNIMTMLNRHRRYGLCRTIGCWEKVLVWYWNCIMSCRWIYAFLSRIYFSIIKFVSSPTLHNLL